MKNIFKILTIQTLFILLCFTAQSQSQCTDGHEPNDTKQTADVWPHPITPNYPAVVTPACFSSTSDQDWYKINIDGTDYYIWVGTYTEGYYQLKISRSCNVLTIETTPKGTLPQADTYISFGTYGTPLGFDNNPQSNFSKIVYTGLAPCSVNYCASSANNSNYEWIDRVSFNGRVNISGNDGGYEDYTDFNTGTFTPGETVWFSIRPGYLGYEYNEYFRIWVDFNNDGDFSDSGETVFSYGPLNTQIGSGFQIPSDTAPGAYRCRVSMKYGGLPSPCQTFTYGEVEDYTINVVAGRIESPGKNKGNAPTQIVTSRTTGNYSLNQGNEGDPRYLELRLYPNPATDFVNLSFEGTQQPDSVELMDITGKVLAAKAANTTDQITFDLVNYPKGLYLLRWQDPTGKVQTKKLLKQ